MGEAHETDYDLETRKQTEKDPAIECHCGKKMQRITWITSASRRFCQFGAISDLNSIFDFEPILNTSRNESTLPENNDYLNTQKLDRNNDMPQKIDVKAGIKLPKTIEEWNAANEYFKATINLSAEITDLNGEVDLLQESIYNYDICCVGVMYSGE